MWVRSHKLTSLGLLTVIMLTGVLVHASSAVEIANYSPDLDISLTSDFLWRFVKDVQYSDGLIYLLMARGILVYDGDVDFISPRLLSQFSLDDSYFSLDVDGATAALCSGTGRLTFLDISDPEDIRVVSSIELGNTILDYASNGVTAFAACGFDGIHVIDLTDSTGSMEVAVLDDAVHAVAVAASEEYQYVADDFNGILAYSLDDSMAPTLIDEALFLEPVTDLALSDGRLYLAQGDSGVVSYELEPPLNLTRVDTYRTAVRAVSTDARDNLISAVDLFGDVYIFDSDTTEPRHVFEERDIFDRFDFGTWNDREYLFFPDESGGFEVISIDEGAELDQVWFYPGSSLITSTALIGELVMVAGSGDDVTVWRVEGDSVPELVVALSMAAKNSYVVALDTLLIVVENSLPENSWLQLFNVLDQSGDLNMRRNLIVWSHVSDIEVEYNDSGTIDLTAFGAEGTSLFTLETLGEEPGDYYVVRERTFVPSRFSQTAAERFGGYLYTSQKKGPGIIYDAADIGQNNELPEVGRFDAGGGTHCIEIIDTLCYLGGGYGLRIHRMDGFQIGELLVEVATEYRVLDLQPDWHDSLMFAAHGDDGVAIYDVADIAEPQLIARINTGGYSELVSVSGGRLAVADRYSVEVFDYSFFREGPILPTRFDLAQNYPNPFNLSTKIEFAIPGDINSAFDVELEIINTLGQLVRTITDTRLPAGFYKYAWDGTDKSGRHVASGIYFYRLSVNGAGTTKKLVFLK